MSYVPLQQEKGFRRSLGFTGYVVSALVAGLSVLGWCYIAYEFSQGFYAHSRDNSDSQYAPFRNNIPLLLAVMIVHVCFRVSDFTRRVWTSLVLSLVFVFALFGFSGLKILLLISINYFVTKALGKSPILPYFVWIYGIGLLFLNDYYKGYPFYSISSHLAWMDNYNGFFRWHILFNFSMLRMVSFTMDYYWHNNQTRKGDMTERERIETSLRTQDYNYRNYLAYMLYAPLYMAGPIITFNNLMHQMRHPPSTITKSAIAKYAFRWIVVVVTMEIMLQLFWVVAIKDTKAWKGFSPMEIYSVGYINLKLIWLKLTIMWRFFRMWAMADGIETVENMNRCMSNNYSGIEFWKDWHRSYNRWLVRYLYVPLGGAKYYALNIFPVFTFVALWHDIELRLLAWGWLIPLFILPELLVTKFFCTKSMRHFFGDWHIHLCAFGAVLNIFMMMTANLVGFAVGLDGMQEMLQQLLQKDGLLFLLQISIGLFGGAHAMFWERAKNFTKPKEH
ncbi:glycerol uptake protein 1 [Gorgonomyces haynaldii]|nr:glycerol uptake protein 1 [Gorgonomyces haynaldii]